VNYELNRTVRQIDRLLRAMGLCRWRQEGRHTWRFWARAGRARVCLLVLALMLDLSGRVQAQDPMIPPPPSGPYPVSYHPHHWWDCLTANDGIPRTYSYYYTPALNQPAHFPVVRPDGKRRWRTTVRGLPMGWQWLAP
jgi:hypothetical protein